MMSLMLPMQSQIAKQNPDNKIQIIIKISRTQFPGAKLKKIMSTFGPATDDDGNDTNQNQICRICFSSSSNLIPAPCNCSGSVGFVHKRCFKRWMESVRNFETCEICHERYGKSTMIPKRQVIQTNLERKTKKEI